MPARQLFIHQYSHATPYHSPTIYLSMELSVMQHKEPSATYGYFPSYLFIFLLLLVIWIGLAITNLFGAILFDFCTGQINLGTFGMGLPSRSSGLSASSMSLASSMSNSSSVSQSSMLPVELFKSPFQLRQYYVYEMLSGALSSSLSNGCR